jgi:hypothetical protein
VSQKPPQHANQRLTPCSADMHVLLTACSACVRSQHPLHWQNQGSSEWLSLPDEVCHHKLTRTVQLAYDRHRLRLRAAVQMQTHGDCTDYPPPSDSNQPAGCRYTRAAAATRPPWQQAGQPTKRPQTRSVQADCTGRRRMVCFGSVLAQLSEATYSLHLA